MAELNGLRLEPSISSRRGFLQAAMGTMIWAPLLSGGAESQTRESLRGQIGITTGSFSANIRAGKFKLLELPRIMREELDMRVIDLMTATLESLEPDYLDRLKSEVEKHRCILTNLKMNQAGLDLGSPDTEVRRKAIDEYKRTIEAAARLGVRWVRPLPGNAKPDLKIYATSYRELIDYAAPRGIGVLIENFGWMQSDPEALPAVIKAVGKDLAAQPDTGNWKEIGRTTPCAMPDWPRRFRWLPHAILRPRSSDRRASTRLTISSAALTLGGTWGFAARGASSTRIPTSRNSSAR